MRNISTGRITASAGMLMLAGTMWGCGGEGDSKLALASRTLASSSSPALLAPAAVTQADGTAGANANANTDADAAATGAAGKDTTDPAPGTDPASGTTAGEDSPAAAPEEAARARDVYSVVNLYPGEAFVGQINARGQAAFEKYGPPDYILHIGYFDGERVLDPLPPGETQTALGALNDRGEMTLMARYLDPAHPLYSNFQPLRWSVARGPVFLPKFTTDSDSYAGAINNRGDIVGFMSTTPDGPDYRSARWPASNRLLPLPGPAGFGDVLASDINDSNISVGYGISASGAAHALRWDAANRPTDLGTFGTGGAVAHAINERGDIAGMLDPVTTSDYQAFLLSAGGGVARIGRNTVFHNMNDLGQVVGRIQRPDNDNRAYLYSRARGLVNLHPGASYFASEANDVNRYGVVVGLARPTTDYLGRAWRWSRAGSVDLNTRLLDPPRGLVVTNALSISANGDIVANSNAGVVVLRHGGRGTDAPVVGPIQLPDPSLSRPTQLTLSFRDRNPGDTHTATVDWGDGRGPQAATVREYRGRGVVRATNTYTAEGDYTVVVSLTDSSGKTTIQRQQYLIRDLGTPMLLGEGKLPEDTIAGKAPGAAPQPTFRLVAPLVTTSNAAKPFTFRLLGRTTFAGERLERVTRNGKLVRLEGSGRLNGRAGYRFTVEATLDSGPARAQRMSVRITEAATGGAQRVAFEAGHGPAATANAQPATPAGLLRHGSLRLME